MRSHSGRWPSQWTMYCTILTCTVLYCTVQLFPCFCSCSHSNCRYPSNIIGILLSSSITVLLRLKTYWTVIQIYSCPKPLLPYKIFQHKHHLYWPIDEMCVEAQQSSRSADVPLCKLTIALPAVNCVFPAVTVQFGDFCVRRWKQIVADISRGEGSKLTEIPNI